MFFFLPIGHDKSVYGRQWATLALLALNVLVFAFTSVSGCQAADELDAAAGRIDQLLAEGATGIDPSLVERIPARLRGPLLGYVAGDTEASDPDLDRAVADLAQALEARPSFRFGWVPAHPQPLTAVSSLFVHADLWHLLGNLLFLWLAGTVIECFWDKAAYLVVYALAGFAGLAAHQLSAPNSDIPLIGASGAIAGLLGAFVVGHPNTRIRMFYAVFALRAFIGTWLIPAWVLIPAWLALQVFYGWLGGDSGVAHWAHVGGFVVGVLGAILMKAMKWEILDGGER